MCTNHIPAKILLIYPPSKLQIHQSFPLGLLNIARILEDAGHEVRVLDANAAKRKMNIPDIVQYAQHMKPDIIGISLLTSFIKSAYQLVAELKKDGVKAKLLAGGPHATIVPEEPLAYGFDAAVNGEGEATIIEAVQGLQGHLSKDQVKGWSYRNTEGKYIRTEPRPPIHNLDDLPLPARHKVNPEDYGKNNAHVLHTNIFSSRGCPARCAFCSGHMFGKKFRFRSAEGMIEEIIHIHKNYGTNHFHFVDDAMTVDKDRMKEFCQRLQEIRLPITWSMMTRIDLVNETLLREAFQAGCTQVDYGVESGHPETLKRIHKPHTVEMVRQVIPMTKAAGIKPYVFFILGFPWEDVRALQNTYDLMIELSAYVDLFHPAVASILIPFPGTEIYEKYKDQYQFENWWLTEERNYGAPTYHKHAYFESKCFYLGTALDADFFHYSPQIKEKIREIFQFMYRHNLKRNGLLARIIRGTMFTCSRKLYTLSPILENIIFSPVQRMEYLTKKVQALI